MKSKSNKFILSTLIAFSLILMSCGSTKLESFPKMYGEKPLTLLIMPPINNTNSVEAKDFFYTTLNTPLAEAGYYVIPPAAAMATMQRESAYDAERFLNGDLKKFREIFGADVAVFTIIKQWDKVVIANRMSVEVEYILKSTKTNEVLFNRNAEVTYNFSTSQSNSGLLGAVLGTVIDTLDTALTDYFSVAVDCNGAALEDLPYGKYHPQHGLDGEEIAKSKKIELEFKK